MRRWMLMVAALMLAGCSLPSVTLFPDQAAPLKEFTLEGRGADKLLLITIDGFIADQPREGLLRSRPGLVPQVVAQLRRAARDPAVKALLLKINSPGGSVTASDILYHEIMDFKADTGARVVAVMMDLAASGGYYVALPADWIVAHPTTVTGSVGVIFMRPQVSGLMQKIGVEVTVNKSGARKDMGSPFRPPTADEDAIFQTLTDQMADRFVDLVVHHRHLAAPVRQQIATARVFMASEAKSLGLIDAVGYLDDALAKARQLAGLPDDARVVVYRRHENEDATVYHPFAGTAPPAGPAAVVPLSGSLLPEAGFYYLWPSVLAP